MRRLGLFLVMLTVMCMSLYSQTALGIIWVKEHVILEQEVVKRDYVTGEGKPDFRYIVDIPMPNTEKAWVEVRWDIWDDWSHENYPIHVVSLKSGVLRLHVYQDVASIVGWKLLIFYTAPERVATTDPGGTEAVSDQFGEAAVVYGDSETEKAKARIARVGDLVKSYVYVGMTVGEVEALLGKRLDIDFYGRSHVGEYIIFWSVNSRSAAVVEHVLDRITMDKIKNTVRDTTMASDTEVFQSLREDTPTDQFGDSQVVYGNAEPELAPEPLPMLSGDIFAESVEDLEAQRRITKRVDPDMKGITLPNGLPSIEIAVEFVIERTGLVSKVVLLGGTGDRSLDARIETALRQWKFVPITQNRQVTARLIYRLRAVQ